MCAVILRLFKVSRLLEVSQSFIISVPFFFFFFLIFPRCLISSPSACSIWTGMSLCNILRVQSTEFLLWNRLALSPLSVDQVHTHIRTHTCSVVFPSPHGELHLLRSFPGDLLYLQPPNTNPSVNLKLKVYMLRCRYMCLTLQGFDLCP